MNDEVPVSERSRRLTLINSIVGVSVAGISTRVFMISVPTLAAALNTDMLGISWALIVYQMAGIGLGVVCGRLGDMYGHNRLFGTGMGIMALGSILCGFSQNVLQLIFFRFLQGVGAAMIQSSARTLGFRAMPKGSEGKAQGLMAMSHQMGFSIGPPLGGLIIDWIHWRGVFFFLFVPSIIGMTLCFTTGRSDAPTHGKEQTIDYWGAILFIVLTVVVTMMMDQKIAHGLPAGAPLLLAAVFGFLVWRFLVHEKKIKHPMINLALFSNRTYAFGSVGLLLANIAHGIVSFIAPFYLQDVLKLSPTFIGIIFLAPSLFSMVLSPVTGTLTDRFGARRLLLAGVIMSMVSYIIGITLRPDSHWFLPAFLLALLGIGSAFFNTPSQAAIISSLPKEHWGTAIGLFNAVFGFGHMLGISLAGIFLTMGFQYYSGISGAAPDPANAPVFASAMNMTYVIALAMMLVPLWTSLQMKKSSQ